MAVKTKRSPFVHIKIAIYGSVNYPLTLIIIAFDPHPYGKIMMINSDTVIHDK